MARGTLEEFKRKNITRREPRRLWESPNDPPFFSLVDLDDSLVFKGP